MSWFETIVFCNRLSVIEGLEPVYAVNGFSQYYYSYWPSLPTSGNGSWMVNIIDEANGYRLPTEIEWEFAAKSGKNYTYAGSNNINDAAWWSGNSGGTTHEVGLKQSAGWGLFDMSGNLSEWSWNENHPKAGNTFFGYFDILNQTNGLMYYDSNLISAKNWDKTVNTTLYA